MVTYPQDWTSAEITEYVDIYQGGTPKTSVAQYWGGSIIWVTPSEITQNGSMYIHNSVRKITEQGLHNSSACLLPIGTILLCTRATIGELSIAESAMTTNQGFKNLVCKSNADNVFFAYLLKTKKDEMIARAIGSTFLELSKKELSKFRVTVPDVTEQKLIAETLSYIDTHIANLTELIEKKKGIRDGALEDLVSGRTRLKGFSGKRENVTFNSVITPKARIGWQGLKKHEYLISGYSYLIGGTDFYHGTVSLSNISYVSKERYDMDTNIQVAANDVLVTKDGTIGKVVIVPPLSKPATLNSGVFVFRTTNRLTPPFLYRVLSSSVFRKFIDALSAGSTIKHLYQKDLKKFEFNIPKDVDEQKAIVEVLSSLDAEIASLEEEKDKMLQIKAGAMDDLLTGRVRLTRQGG